MARRIAQLATRRMERPQYAAIAPSAFRIRIAAHALVMAASCNGCDDHEAIYATEKIRNQFTCVHTPLLSFMSLCSAPCPNQSNRERLQMH